MRYFYDTEFLEDGTVIELISIGIVADDGREYYAVNAGITRRSLRRRIQRHDWLMENVVPHLPKPHGDWNNHMPKSWLFNYSANEVKSRDQIANEVREFLLAGDEVELWADYGAYDHVCLAQLWGRMINLPDGVPMYTNDLQQLLRARGIDEQSLPPRAADAHHALADARYLAKCIRLLDEGTDR